LVISSRWDVFGAWDRVLLSLFLLIAFAAFRVRFLYGFVCGDSDFERDLPRLCIAGSFSDFDKSLLECGFRA